MFYHMRFVKEDRHEHKGMVYEIRVFRAKEDGHFRSYVSTDAISALIIEGVDLPPWAAEEMKRQGVNDPVDAIIRYTKDEIDAGRLHLE